MEVVVGEILEGISEKIEKSGFKPFGVFTAVDNLVYGDYAVGFYGEGDCRLVATSIHHTTLKRAAEVEYIFQVKLMGRRCGFDDYEEFCGMCDKFCFSTVPDVESSVCGINVGRVEKNVSLGRFERTVTVTVRTCIVGV